MYVSLTKRRKRQNTLIFARFIEHKYIFTQMQFNAIHRKKKRIKTKHKKVFNVRTKYQFRIPMEHYDEAYYQLEWKSVQTKRCERERERGEERGARVQVRQCARSLYKI